MLFSCVIGFGDGVDAPAAVTQLNNMADWGSGGALDYYDANNQAALAQALSDIIAVIEFDPCCGFNDCSETPEPDTGEPDELPSDDEPETAEDLDGDGMDSLTSESDTATESESETDTSDDSTETSAGETADTETGDGDGDTTSESGTDESSSGEDEIGSETASVDDLGGADDIWDVDEGCNCSVPDSDRERTQGLLGSLLALGIAGSLGRRRRRI